MYFVWVVAKLCLYLTYQKQNDMATLTSERAANSRLSDLISELSKLQKLHLERISIIEKLPDDHYQIAAEMAGLYSIEESIQDQFDKYEELS